MNHTYTAVVTQLGGGHPGNLWTLHEQNIYMLPDAPPTLSQYCKQTGKTRKEMNLRLNLSAKLDQTPDTHLWIEAYMCRQRIHRLTILSHVVSQTCSHVNTADNQSQVFHWTHYRSFWRQSYRSDDPTNSVIPLNDNGQSTRSRVIPTMFRLIKINIKNLTKKNIKIYIYHHEDQICSSAQKIES